MSCKCTEAKGNSGVIGCKQLMDVGRILVIMNMIADDGTPNQIDLASDTVNAAYIDAKLNEADPSKRWYPTPVFDNITDERNESMKETLDSGANIYVKQGTRPFTGVMVKQSNVLLEKMENWRCSNIGALVIDVAGSLIGDISTDGLFLKPTSIDQNTWDPTLIKAKDATSQKIKLDFEWDIAVKDGDLRMITADEITDYDLLLINGLLDVNVVITPITTDKITVTLTLDYGTALAKIPVVGWGLADFSANNITTGSPIVWDSIVEVSPGVYELDSPAQTAADEAELLASKTGYDFPTTDYTY